MGDRIRVDSACMADENVNYSRKRLGRGRGFRGNQDTNRASGYKPQGNFNYKAKLNTSVNSNGPDEKKVVETPGDTLFKFGGGTVLQSTKKVTFPCARIECEIQSDVVTRDISLLLSKDSMEKAKMKLDLENDSANTFEKDVQLHCTSSGHYCVPIDQLKIDIKVTVTALVATDMTRDKTKIIEKLHKQFAHPSAKRLKTLLKDAGGYTKEHFESVDKIIEGCDVCKKYKKTPVQPVVSLPLAAEFNEVVAVDLKEWKPITYFLHLIEIATRFSFATVIKRKIPDVIADKIMYLWIEIGMGPQKNFLADNGGEFANEIFRDMCANLNIDVMNTAKNSPWQNGICEHNHAVVDVCVAKILEDQPKLNLNVALVWALNAKKNSLWLIRCGTEFKDMQSKQLNLNNNNAKPVREKIHPTGIYDSEDDEEKNNRNEEQEPLQNENDHQQNIQHSQMQYDDNEQVDQNLAPGAAFDNCDQTDENEDAKVGIDFAKDVQEWRKAQDVD
ncbi:unnamed protein product [Mytilus edulis]|uniref:Integrase catalytic domain-containing protein n=1 Tax=Mytilus edulis TaxID=6550 RepID=A0A8S3TQR2_MYTED|nr:unnamed protein product [Mytilus edulis]